MQGIQQNAWKMYSGHLQILQLWPRSSCGFDTRQCLTALLPRILRGQLFKHLSLNVSKKRAHSSTMMLFEPSVLFPGPIEHMWVWVGSSHSQIILLTFMLNTSLIFFSLCSWFFTSWFSKSKAVTKTQHVGKRPPYSCIKEKLSQKKAGLLSDAAPTCFSYPSSPIHFSDSFSLCPSKDSVGATSPCKTKEDRRTSWKRNALSY